MPRQTLIPCTPSKSSASVSSTRDATPQVQRPRSKVHGPPPRLLAVFGKCLEVKKLANRHSPQAAANSHGMERVSTNLPSRHSTRLPFPSSLTHRSVSCRCVIPKGHGHRSNAGASDATAAKCWSHSHSSIGSPCSNPTYPVLPVAPACLSSGVEW